MKKIIVILLSAVIVLGGGYVLINNAIKSTSQTTMATPINTVSQAIKQPTFSVKPTTTVKASATAKTTTKEPENTTLISFCGDCTLGSQHNTWTNSNSFNAIVGSNYDYPFAKVKSFLSKDDMTLVNLEGVLTNYNVPVSKQFNFRSSPEKVDILVRGSVEAVNLANNHTMDYGQTGYDDTIAALKSKNILYSGNGVTSVYTTSDGVKIGMLGYKFINSSSSFSKDIQKLKDQGCQIVILSMHWGVEATYSPTSQQVTLAKAAIDAGADIVVGTHPHVLQKIDTYKGKYILYSLGNFVFGGNTNPSDKDTALVQATFTTKDGAVTATKLKVIPCSLSGKSSANNYQPVTLSDTSDAAKRVYTKLNWSAGKNN